ncbi:PD-(D/E)XK nuclease domain-containing protein [Thiothrix lacustris]|uniref:PD-(D/E)XK nuclease domain-containing protein n=1 Tax=Thiothrix lacustris TaxID=525917 RepID=UPI0027E53F6F|nr:PD-(D/E)XK nuclease domain-containing protein [Thiothrix lacustris]WMP19315.1 PD-(D/E)XK nuclease domain-containing protein [Thiothrix lacustris]
MSYLDAGQFTNYWFSTGTPTFLLKLMRKKWIYDISAVELSELAFSSYDVEDLQVYPILFQTGYLTIKGRNEFGLYCMGYPNREVQESMLMYLISNVAQDESSMSKTMVLQIRAAFYQNDMDSLIRLINSIFKNIPSHIFIAEAEAYYHSLIFLVFFYLGQYAESEVNTNNGRLDCVVKTDKHIYVIEFKLNQSAKVALQQIKDKGYAEKYRVDSRQKVLLGVNFSSEGKAVKDWLVENLNQILS